VGEVAPELLAGYADLGALRTAELTAAARELGLAAVHFLGYRDSGMPGVPDNSHPRALAAAPLAQVSRQIVALIRAIQPQVIVTFNPYGGYGHPDHIAIHRATLAAFGAAGDPAQHRDLADRGLDAWEPQKLYFHTFSTANLRWILVGLRLFGKDPRHFGQNGDVDLVRAVEQAGRITTRLDNRAYAPARERASAAHRSQGGGTAFFGRLPRRLRHRFLGVEEFARIVPPAPRGTPLETDLFAGVRDS
jgi:mycothiol S-conjugate amidase